MSSAVSRMINQGKVSPPKFLEDNLMLEVIMGSRCYGVNDPKSADFDIYGVCIPPKAYVFPSTQGLIAGFDRLPTFDQWSEHHIQDQDGKRSYDFAIYNIVKFFHLAAENNPNMVDMIFVPETCVKHCAPVGRLILDNRKLFLSKLCWKKFRGYASDQFHKLVGKNPKGLRAELIERHGYDTKFGYHIIRLLREVEQILTEGDLNLMQGNEELKAIRAGEWTFERLEKEFVARKLALEATFSSCKLPEVPDHGKLKKLLMECLEMHYGSLAKVAPQPDFATQALRDIDLILQRERHNL